MLSKDISPGLPEGDDFFLQQVSIGISDVIDEEQQMSTRDRNTAGTVIPFLPKFTKGEFYLKTSFHTWVTVLYSEDINSSKMTLLKVNLIENNN